MTVTTLLVAGVVIGMAHNAALEAGRPFLVQDVIRTILSPACRGITAVAAVGDTAIRAVKPRYALLKENEQLRKQVHRLERENSALREVRAENAHLRAALGVKEASPYELIASQVIMRNESSWFDTATIDVGRQSGVVRGSAVIDQRGQLVGQVLEVDAFTSQVVSLTDPSSAISGMVERSRSVGILQGQGADFPILSYLPKDADVRVSDVVVSAGMGKVVPKGFMMGRVVKVARNSTAGTTAAVLRPSARFDQVERVFVVKPGGR